MYIVVLTFADTSVAAEHMPGHKNWIRQGVDDGVFLLVGSIQPPTGGVILATGSSRDAVEERVRLDPFVEHGVVTAEVIEVAPNTADPRLSFLLTAAS